MKNRLIFLFKFLFSFLILGLLWLMLYKPYISTLIRVVRLSSVFSSLQRIWIRKETIYFSFKDTIITPIPQISIKKFLSITTDMIMILALLLATTGMDYTKRLKNIVLAIFITIFIHICVIHLNIFAIKCAATCTTSFLKEPLSRWPGIIFYKIIYFSNTFWLQIGYKFYPIVLWIILAYEQIFKKNIFQIKRLEELKD